MKIISGILGGRAVKVHQSIRPTLGKVREAVFSMIDVNEKLFLDLFAGTGAVGIEAYSRGAKEVWFVEKNEKIYALLKENLLDLKVKGKAIKGNVFSVLKNINKKFDIVYLDPPYNEGMVQKILDILPSVLNDDSLVIIESSKREEFEIKDYEKIKQKKYGDTIITILK